MESACYATRDLSLFKPHIKTSSSTTPSRRSPYSSSLVQRGSARQFFLTIFFAAIFFPFQTVVWQEGRFAPPRRSPPQPPHNGEVVGSRALFLFGRLATAWSTPGWLGGLWGDLLDSGDSTGWLSDPLRPSTSSIRAASLSLLAYSRQPIKVVAFIQELQILLRKGAVESASQSPGFYNSLFLIQKASGSWHPIIDFLP